MMWWIKRSKPGSNGMEGLGLTVSLWHDFKKPPFGGGNQFMLALKEGLERLGVDARVNSLDKDVDVHLLHATWFDVRRFAAHACHNRLIAVHRIDGPISLYRGSDRDLDEECFALNKEFASATVLQSNWSYRETIEMGYQPVNPRVILNAANGRIFHPRGRKSFDPQEKIRLIATSWSDNPRKGGPVYKWLEDHLDWGRYEFTFVGRTQEQFSQVRQIPPVPSEQLAEILRQHDIYITTSQNDPCSNAVIEALSCGLPALYLNEGGHPELVGSGGLPFDNVDEILPQLDVLVEHYEMFQKRIVVPSLEEIAKKYLTLLLEVLY